jgi:hypothetical protein
VTSKNKEKIPVRDRRVTVNISIPLKVLFAIDERCDEGKRSEYVTEILLRALNL